jgi:hypothetical protein
MFLYSIGWIWPRGIIQLQWLPAGIVDDTASSSWSGTLTIISIPAAYNLAKCRASRRSVLILSPGALGTNEGVMTFVLLQFK